MLVISIGWSSATVLTTVTVFSLFPIKGEGVGARHVMRLIPVSVLLYSVCWSCHLIIKIIFWLNDFILWSSLLSLLSRSLRSAKISQFFPFWFPADLAGRGNDSIWGGEKEIIRVCRWETGDVSCVSVHCTLAQGYDCKKWLSATQALAGSPLAAVLCTPPWWWLPCCPASRRVRLQMFPIVSLFMLNLPFTSTRPL